MAELAETEQADPLRILMEVQQRDLLMDQLAYRRRELEQRKALASIESRVAALADRAQRLGSERSVLAQRQEQIENHVTAYSNRIAAIESRLREGGAYREVQAMSAETDSLSRHRRELEDNELEVMEQLEPVDQELEAIEGELAALRSESESATGALASAEASLDAEAGTVQAERAALAVSLPADLAATYERLRQRLGGIGAARLLDGACGGCHLKLPSGERERVLHATPGQVVFCDQCGRILVA